jgi:hypothetical protein
MLLLVFCFGQIVFYRLSWVHVVIFGFFAFFRPQFLEQWSRHGMMLILKFPNPWKWWNPRILLGTMFKVSTFVTPYWIKVSLYPWFGLGVLGCTSKILGSWVKERLGQIWGLFEGYWWLELGFWVKKEILGQIWCYLRGFGL